MTRIYVAGPLTRGDVEANVRRAIEAGNKLLDMGYAPYIPHLSYYQDQAQQRDYEDWMALDFVWLKQCHMLLRLPGESPGADREVEFANENKIPVYVFSPCGEYLIHIPTRTHYISTQSHVLHGNYDWHYVGYVAEA